MAVQPVRNESFNGKEEIDEAQHPPQTFGNKPFLDEKQEDLDIGAQVCRTIQPCSSGKKY